MKPGREPLGPQTQRKRGWISFVRATIVGGMTFLLPFGILLVIGDRLIAFVQPVAARANQLMFPQFEREFVAFALAFSMLVLLAFGAGLLARSPWGTAAGWGGRSLR